jgi:cell division transport system permease protein
MARRGERRRVPRSTAILPREQRDAPLIVVMAILCFLACLAGVGAHIAYTQAERWTDSLRGSMTARVIDAPASDSGATARRAAEAASALAGVIEARVIERDEAAKLLEPWFGAEALPDDLPVPVLIAIDVDPAAGVSAQDVAAALESVGAAATVDDHARWSQDVRRAADLARGLAFGVLALLAAAAGAAIAFAARAGFQARRDIVEVLHLMGARDDFIAAEFERRFLAIGVRAGTLGAVMAGGSVYALAYAAQQPEARAWLLPQAAISPLDWAILLAAPLLAGFVAMTTARAAVMSALRKLA